MELKGRGENAKISGEAKLKRTVTEGDGYFKSFANDVFNSERWYLYLISLNHRLVFDKNVPASAVNESPKVLASKLGQSSHSGCAAAPAGEAWNYSRSQMEIHQKGRFISQQIKFIQ